MNELKELGHLINNSINEQLKIIDSADIAKEQKDKLRDFANGIKKSIATQDTTILTELIEKLK